MNLNLKFAAVALASVVATLGVTSVVHRSMDKGIGHFANADSDNNGEITTAEWSAAATTGFQKLDTNKDGKLVIGEIPRGGPRGHRRGHNGPDDGPGADWDADEQPALAPAASTAPARNAVIGNTAN
ncbi:MAG: EF-hand domain-containing protein [Pseudomonadota bacterium]